MSIPLDSHRFTDNEVLELDRGQEYTLAATKAIEVNGVTIRAREGSGNPPQLTYSGGSQTNALYHRQRVGLEINGINFSAPNGGYLLGSYFGQNATLRHVTINGAGTGGLFHGTADKFTVIEWCRSPIIVGWYGIYSGPYTYNTIPNINPAGMQLNNNYFAGTVAQHVVRLHGMEGLNVDQCVFENPTKDKQAFRFHQGKDALITNTFFRGSVYFGPLAGADGGIQMAAGAERDYIMSLRLSNVQVKGCLVRGNIHVDAGTSGLVIEDTLIKGPAAAGTSWPSCMQIEGTYDTRPVPQFTLNRVDMLHPTKGLTGNLTGKTILNSTYNGAPLT